MDLEIFFFCKKNIDTTKHFIDEMFKSLSKLRKKVIWFLCRCWGGDTSQKNSHSKT